MKGSRILFGSLFLLSICSGQITFPDVQNPHGNNQCPVCHDDQGEPSKTNFNSDACDKCHSRDVVNTDIHQLNNINPRSEDIVIPEDFLHLRSSDEFSCNACHSEACTTDRANRKFLRGGPYSSELDFCYRCHQKSIYKQFNPHLQIREDGSVDESTCLHCHALVPDIASSSSENNKMHLEMTPTCNKCHALHTHEDQHLGKSVIAPGKGIQERMNRVEQQFQIKFPLSDNLELRCNTCHYTHQRGLLEQDDVILAGPEGNQWFLRLPRKQLCFACHSL